MLSYSVCWTIALGLVTLLGAIYLYCRHALTYWKRRGVTQLPASLPYGNIRDLILGYSNFGLTTASFYKQLDVPYVGLYMMVKPVLLLRDPEVIKAMLVKEFNSFPDRGGYYNEVHDPLSANMFAIRGQKWKILRNKITPTFTSGKMKMMFSILATISKELEEVLDKECSTGKPVGVKDLLARFTIDIIGSCVFGLDCNSLKNPNTEFRKYGQKFLVGTLSNMPLFIFGFLYPKVLKAFNVKMIDEECSTFFIDVLRKNIEYREKNNIHRKDFMDLFIRLKNNENITDEALIVESKTQDQEVNNGITFYELAAQAFVFFIAGYETSSTASSICLFELAKNKDIQEKVRKEIRTVLERHNGELTYDALSEMQYLDQVLNETLRKYPIAPNMIRVCRETCQLTEGLVVEKGTFVWVPIMGIHNDPKIYPDPDKFDPERFTEEEKAKRHPFTYLPFGEGPRSCIGNRFALMQTKVSLVAVLQNHDFSLADPKSELQWSIKGFLLFPRDEIYMKVNKIH